jgi:hypothetical protein
MRSGKEAEVSGARDLVSLLESRRSTDVNLAVLLLSSLIGAGVGSAVTTLLTR